jgi:hypothetical protein
MAAVMGILVVFANACSRKDQQQQMMGGKPMDTSLNASIELLNPNDNRKVDSLVESIRSHAWEQTRQVVEMAKQKDPDEQSVQNARLVLLSLGDVGLTPLLDSLPSDSPEKLVWSLQTAVGFHRDNQARIVKILNQLLADKRQLPPHEQGPFTEEKIPDRRVCDEAYLLMRRLLAMEGEDDNMVNSRIFLYSMSGEERDKEIARLLNTKTWVALTEQAEAMPNVRE